MRRALLTLVWLVPFMGLPAAGQETPREAIQEPRVATTQEGPAEATQEGPAEATQEGPAEASQEGPAEVPQPAPADDSPEAPKDASEWLPEGPESSNEAFPVRFNGVFMLQMDDGERGNRSRSTSLPTLDGVSAYPAETSLSIRRLRLSMTARLARELDFVVQGHFDTRDEEANLRDLYLRYRIQDNLTLLAGQFKMRWGFEGFRSSSEANTIERSDATRALYQGRDLGLNLGGRNGQLEWDVGVFAGQRLELADRDSRRDVAARLLWHFNESLRAGMSVQHGSHVPEGTNIGLPSTRLNGELQFQDGPWRVEAEAMYGDGYNFFSEGDTRALGGYLATIYRLDDQWDLVLHLDALDPALGLVDRTFPDNGLNARSRVVLGVNYYIARKPEHRFQFNYELNQQWEGPSFPQNGFRARYQFRF